MSQGEIRIPATLRNQRWVLDYDPARPSPFWIRFASSPEGEPDLKPIRNTCDIVGTGETFHEALEMARSDFPEFRQSTLQAVAKRWADAAGHSIQR